MKAHLVVAASVLLSAPLIATSAFADSLSSQIDAVGSAQQSYDQQQDAARAQQKAYQQHLEEERIRTKDQAELIRAKARAAAAKRRAEREKHNEAYQDKVRKLELSQAKSQVSYAAQMRQLKIQQAELKLQELKVRAGRENDFLNQKLAREKAQTNVIQSQANSNNDLAKGTQSLLTNTGKAEIIGASNKSSH